MLSVFIRITLWLLCGHSIWASIWKLDNAFSCLFTQVVNVTKQIDKITPYIALHTKQWHTCNNALQQLFVMDGQTLYCFENVSHACQCVECALCCIMPVFIMSTGKSVQHIRHMQQCRHCEVVRLWGVWGTEYRQCQHRSHCTPWVHFTVLFFSCWELTDRY